MELGIANRNAFVCGATHGIGEATARAMAAEGANLFLVSRTADRLRDLAHDLESKHGVKVAWTTGDFTEPGEGQRAAEAALEAFSDIHILVNNAGASMPGSLDTTTEQWHASYQLNFLSHLEVIRTILPDMRARRWGRIINISGTAYRWPTNFSTGTVAKYGLLNTSQVTAREVARDGVTINAVTVGFIETAQITKMFEAEPKLKRAVLDEIPMERLGTPQEVADAVLFLASEQASYTTASTVTIDGGADPVLI